MEVKENDVLAPVPDTGTWQGGSLSTTPRCFDLLCTGSCELGSDNQKLKLDIVPADKIPNFFTKNSNGDVVFAEPKPVCTIRAPKGHSTAIEIELKTVLGEYSDIAKYVCLGIRRKNSCEYLNILSASKNAEGNHSGGFDISDNSEMELIPLISNVDLSKSSYEAVTIGGVISNSGVPFPANEFDFGSVYRISVKDLTIAWLENQPSNLSTIRGDAPWSNYGHYGVGKVNGIDNQLVAIERMAGQLAYSSDGGTTWHKWGEAFGSANWFAGPTYGNGTWCVINSGGEIRHKKDEDDLWSSASSIVLPLSLSINFGNDIFMLIGSDDKVYTSPDAENWKLVGIVPNDRTQIRSLVYGKDKWICANINGELYFSEDETGAGEWNYVGSVAGCLYISTFIHGYFYATDGHCRVLRSSDGKNWSQINQLNKTSSYYENITLLNGKLYVFAINGTHYHVGSFPN